jgi:hypothetical protein
LAGRYSEDTKKQKATRLIQQNIQPAGTQTIRTREGLQASKGYNESPSGRIRFFGEETSPFIKMQAGVFGKNVLPGVKDYYKEDKKILGEGQTEKFKSLSADEKNIYGEQVMAKRGHKEESKGLLSFLPFGAKEAEAEVSTELPTNKNDFKVLYEDALSTIKKYPDEASKVRTGLKDDKTVEQLNQETFEANELVRRMEKEKPEMVYKIGLEIYPDKSTDDRSVWAYKWLEKARNTEEYNSWYKDMLDKKIITKTVLKKMKKLGFTGNEYTEGGKIKTYSGSGGKKAPKPAYTTPKIAKPKIGTFKFKRGPALKMDFDKFLKTGNKKKLKIEPLKGL